MFSLLCSFIFIEPQANQELEFLKDSDVVSEELFNQLTQVLPRKYAQGAPPIAAISVAGNGNAARPSDPNTHQPSPDRTMNEKTPIPPPSHSPAPSNAPSNNGQEIVEALYDYNARDATDLALHRGNRIAVLEKLNGDWWRGRDLNSGNEGIFPSNYVRASDSGYGAGGDDGKKGMYMQPPPQQQQQQQYYPPPQQMYPAQSAPPYYPPPSTNYYQQPPPEQAAPQPEQQQQPHRHHGGAAMKKFGSKLGNAAIFGAGATIGSDIVNSIF